jgi:hypothetical protein
MDRKAQEAPRKPSVVYDIKMPVYVYRDDPALSKTVDAGQPKSDNFKLNCLANLTAV